MKTRKYEANDIEAMQHIWNSVVEAADAFPQDTPMNRTEAAAFFAAQTYCGVAEREDGTVAGLYILHPNNVGRCAHICNASYAVDSQCRNMHIGEALVRDCLVQAKKAGFRVLQFNAVVATNKPALHLYKKLGFTQMGTIPQGFRLADGSYADIIPHYIVL